MTNQRPQPQIAGTFVLEMTVNCGMRRHGTVAGPLRTTFQGEYTS